MDDAELRARGRAMRRELLGPDATDELDRTTYDDDPIMQKFGDLTQDYIFGMLWARPGLDLKTRSLITVAADIATNQTDALALHLRFLLRHGFTEDEIVEVILHLMGYVGVPSARRAMVVASRVFAEVRAEQQSSTPSED
ncbi:carboxymuconolactone decarboxylase family protein [Microbacterium sp. X-17]|uniref:carboxymuconolactone decarboxylase family protein n=1 Tax=Microbacterium sp. X-17 TaxID=3144404 RepID=UPI0031F4A720